MQTHLEQEEGDFDIVATWLKRDRVRWAAGAAAGIFAGLVATAFSMLFAKMMGYEIWYAIKVAALPLLGSDATEYGFIAKNICTGFLFSQFLAALLGVFYAHMTGTNRFFPLFGMGLVWASFIWIFWINLYGMSFPAYRWAHIPKGITFLVLVIYGVSLTSTSIFDRLFRGSKAA